MKVRTVSDLQDRLDAEVAWRVKEIAALKDAVRNSRWQSRNTVIRAGVPLLYAHWEGFVKNAAKAYIYFVALRRLKFEELSNNFVVLGAKGHIQSLKDAKKTEVNIQTVEFFRSRFSERANIRPDDAIDTKGNLSSDVFKEIMDTLGIDCSKYEPRYPLIDRSLLRRRNNIAHGEALDLNGKAYQDLADEVILLLRTVKTDIENAASMGSYRRASANGDGIAAVEQ